MTTGLDVQLRLLGIWTSVQTYVRAVDPLVITRGIHNEGGEADPSSCSVVLDNRNGEWTAKNPRAFTFGWGVGRNMPLRVTLPGSIVRAVVPPGAPSSLGGITAPDSAPLSITGDLDLRIDLELPSWRRLLNFMGKSRPLSGQWSYSFLLNANGTLSLVFSTNGTSTTVINSTAPLPAPFTGRRSVRVTFDVNNGAGGKTATFYYSDTAGTSGPWTQLGSPVTTAGTVTLFDSTAPAYVGGNGFDLGTLGMEIYGAEFRSGIGGTVVASPTLTAQSDGATSFADAQGNTWSIVADAEISNRDVRFSGEVSATDYRSDSTGTDVTAHLQTSGILRRVGRKSTPVISPMRRGIVPLFPQNTALRAYWPLEDEADALQLASALTGGRAMRVIGKIKPADYDGFNASRPLPRIASGSLTGAVAAYASTGSCQLRFVVAIPSGAIPNGTVLARLMLSGTLPRWDLVYATNDNFSLKAYDSTGALIHDSGVFAIGPYGEVPTRMSVELSAGAGVVNYTVVRLGTDGGAGVFSGSATGTAGAAQSVAFNPGRVNCGDAALGHVTIEDKLDPLALSILKPFSAHLGETAARRIERLCAENNVPAVLVGDLDRSVRMGPQQIAPLPDLLKECAETDCGILAEYREALAVLFRPLSSLVTQTAKAQLAFGDLIDVEMEDDDAYLVNDVTAAQPNAGNYRLTKETGALSIAEIGRYESQVTANVMDGDLLPDAASWALHLGTVDEERYPEIEIHLQRDAVASDPALSASVRALDIGDRFTVSGIPLHVAPRDIDQLTLGMVETLSAFEHRIAAHGRPARPFLVAVADDGVSRYATTSQLAASATAGDTSLSVVTTAGPRWTTAPAHFPFDILLSGERITVTGITGTTLTQTFTVIRAVNGISKSLAAGTPVAFWEPRYWNR